MNKHVTYLKTCVAPGNQRGFERERKLSQKYNYCGNAANGTLKLNHSLERCLADFSDQAWESNRLHGACVVAAHMGPVHVMRDQEVLSLRVGPAERFEISATICKYNFI